MIQVESLEKDDVLELLATLGNDIHPGFKAEPVRGADHPLLLQPLSATSAKGEKWRLSLTVALDVRKTPSVPVRVETGEGEWLGVLEIHVPCPFEPFLLDLDAGQAARVRETGVRLSVPEEFESRIWFFTAAPPDEGAARLLPTLSPLGFTSEHNRRTAFRRTLFSLASLQPFGWLEGCVMDGLKAYDEFLADPAALAALQAHWHYFGGGTPDGLRYCDPYSRLRCNEIYGREGGLPFASLDRASHPELVNLWAEFALCFDAGEASSGDANDYSAEGCYTVAYPAAVAGALRGDSGLGEAAFRVLNRRINALWQGGRFSQGRDRYGRRAFVNWGRGIAWLLLGIIRSAPYLDQKRVEKELRPTFEAVARWVSLYPRVDGLWASYLDDLASGPETSGSCGIAAALALGIRCGWLPKAEFGVLVCEVRDAAMKHVTPEGWLGAVSQINRGGDALQRGGYRVYSAMGMGLLGLLDAAVESMPDGIRPIAVAPAGNA